MDKNCIERNQVVFLGKVDYDKLGEVIQGHAIGYAMGTSIIEMTQYGIPVIMAMASPDYKLFSKDIWGGLYVNKSQGNVGVDLILRSRHMNVFERCLILRLTQKRIYHL